MQAATGLKSCRLPLCWQESKNAIVFDWLFVVRFTSAAAAAEVELKSPNLHFQ
jgi:hypothetical protein